MGDWPKGHVVVRAVAFDLDETLAVTTRDREALLERAADRAGVELDFDRDDYREAHRSHSGTETRRPVFEALVDDDAGTLTDAYREAIGESLEPAAAALETVERLREEYLVGLLTDGPEDTQRDKLERLGWTDAFDAVVVTGGIDSPKPDPAAFEALCRALGSDPAETVFVGDDPERDVAGAAAAGLRTIQVTYDGGPAVHPDADATVDRSSLSGLPALLADRFGDGADDP